jgi:hypothetical protein
VGVVPCKGGVCGTGKICCFTAGTLISTESGWVPIETIQPGDRVHSLDASACTEAIEAESCRMVELQVVNPDGYDDLLTTRFLTSEAWVREHGVREGGTVPVDFDEPAVHGVGRVTRVETCTLSKAPGCLVTMTVTHLDRSVLRLHFEGTSHTVETTALHRFWSVDRAAWVAAGDLAIGERVLGSDETAAIASSERVDGAHQVFNFEVAGAHTYLVSELKLKTHNNCLYYDVNYAMPPEQIVAMDALPEAMRNDFTKDPNSTHRV